MRSGCKFLLWNLLRYNAYSCPILYLFCTMALNFCSLPKTWGRTRWTHDTLTRSYPPHVFLCIQVVVSCVVASGRFWVYPDVGLSFTDQGMKFGSQCMWKIFEWCLAEITSVCTEIVYNSHEIHNFASISLMPWQKWLFFCQDYFNYCKNLVFESS